MNIQKTFLLLVLISSHFYIAPSAQPKLKKSGAPLIDLRLSYAAQKPTMKPIAQKTDKEKFEDDLADLYSMNFAVPACKNETAIAFPVAYAIKQLKLKSHQEYQAQHQKQSTSCSASNLAAVNKAQSATNAKPLLNDLNIHTENQHPDDQLMEEVYGEFFN